MSKVQCQSCHLTQYAEATCSGCGAPLPLYIVTIERQSFDGTLDEIINAAAIARVKKLGTVVKAAESLGMGRTTLYRRFKRMGIKI